jgi:hypothetical protein
MAKKLDKAIDAIYSREDHKIAVSLGVQDDMDTYSVMLAAQKMANHFKDQL